MSKSKTNLGDEFEEQFVQAMRRIGGYRPTDRDQRWSETSSPDVILPTEKVIIEIKTLTRDPRTTPQFHDELRTKYNKWVEQGLVPRKNGKFTINTDELPIQCAYQLINWMSQRVHDHAKKANRQLRQAKTELDDPDYRGLFLLCNAGNQFVTPHVVLNRLARSLSSNKSSIDWVIYMTYQCPVVLPGTKQPVELFCQPTRVTFPKMPIEILEAIKVAWMKYESQNHFVAEYSGSKHDVLFDLRHQEKMTAA